MLGVLGLKVELQTGGKVLDFLFTRQEYENTARRQLAVDFCHFFETCLLVVLFCFLRKDRRNWELTGLHVDAVGR